MGVLYEKVGRRYKPVRDDDALNGLSNGTWLVRVKGGLTQIRQPVDPGPTIEQMAAALEMEDHIADILRDVCRYEWGGMRPLTPLERKAAKAYRAVMGYEAEIWMSRPAIATTAERIAKRIVEMAAIEREEQRP